MPKTPVMGMVGNIAKVTPKGKATVKPAITRKPTAVKIRRSSFNPKMP